MIQSKLTVKVYFSMLANVFFCKGEEGEVVYSNKVLAPSGWIGWDVAKLIIVFDSLSVFSTD